MQARATGQLTVSTMNIYIDESIHEKYGFMLIAYVLCKKSPNDDLQKILMSYGVSEFHASDKMSINKAMQEVKQEFLSYINSNSYWGVMVFPCGSRFNLLSDLLNLLNEIYKNGIIKHCNLFIDEGIVSKQELIEIQKIGFIDTAQICNSALEQGVQLADLVAALCGVRLRDEIGQNPKFLSYGNKSGYDPPIEAEIGYELWASLRYSMLHSDTPFGEDMPSMAMFPTYGYGFFISDSCSNELKEKTDKTFGAVYLGCIH